MPRDRFYAITRHFHLVDSTKQAKKEEIGYDPLFKVRPVIDQILDCCKKYYQPGQELSIDEMMIGTRCRIFFLQYMPKKPAKFGVKVWVNAETKTGYILNFQVYTGAVNELSSKGLAHRVVIDLMEEFQGRGHKVFFDNFYTSAPLLKELLENGTWACGTIRQNRKDFPPALRVSEGSHLKPGEFQFATSGQITLVHWYDHRDVYVMSTMHGTTYC